MKKKKVSVPNPGSDEAVAKGCKCPVLDNAHGDGWLGMGSKPFGLGGNLFWMAANCPLHGDPKLQQRSTYCKTKESK